MKSRKLHRIIRTINHEAHFVNVLRINHIALATTSGILAVAGFAPWNIFLLPIFSLALLFYLLVQAPSPRNAAWLGFAFGLGLFGADMNGLYIALHDIGKMSVLLASLAALLFAGFLALFPALMAYLQARISLPKLIKLALLLPALWVSQELLRGYLFTGFPWLVLGYSQVADSPLAGYAPILGVYGVSLFMAISAGLLALLVHLRWTKSGKAVFAVLLTVWLTGGALSMVKWTHPEGSPIKVSLLQGNIAQDEKFNQGRLITTLETYQRLVQSSDAKLIVLPETALPLLRSELPRNYINILQEHARQQDGDVLIGAFEHDGKAYYNSMFSLGSSASQSYRKSHLVPFGEFIPLRPLLGWFINELLNIPMSDLGSGGIHQPLLNLAGQRIAVNICFEDVFGEEIIRALPQASLLVNTSNDAWYGDSAAAMQHNQFSQMRALETGRMMLRATNTGVSSVIDRNGRILQTLPQHQEGVLTAQIQGYTGSTPYVRWGNAAISVLLLIMFAVTWQIRRRKASGE
ncbi:MAG: apolipoprotein N-acyltransferase [Gallionellaceae bacterium]